MGGSVPVKEGMQRSEDILGNSIFCFHCPGPRDWTQDIRLCSKCLYRLCHLASSFLKIIMCVLVCEYCGTSASMVHIWRSENNFLESFLSTLLRHGLSLLHQLACKLLSNSADFASHVTKCQGYRCTYLPPAFSEGSVLGHQAYIASMFTWWATIVLFCLEIGSYYVALAVQELTRPRWPQTQQISACSLYIDNSFFRDYLWMQILLHGY